MGKTVISGLVLAQLGCASAFAAGMPVKAPPVSVSSWTGHYLGVHAGFGWGEKYWRTDFTSNYTVIGAFAGGQVGYNYQSGNLVFGIEAEWSWSGISGGRVLALGPLTISNRTDVEWIAALTGRIGYAVGPWLGYLKVGPAWVHERHGVTLAGSLNGSLAGDETRRTWIIGGGIERTWGDAWSVKIEYNYVVLGLNTAMLYDVSGVVPGAVPAPIDQHLHLAKIGLNYRFDRTARAVAAGTVWSGPWSGPYAGLHVGHGWAAKAWPDLIDPTAGLPVPTYTARGYLIGGQVGFDAQFGRVVVGIEADVSAADIAGDAQDIVFGFLPYNIATRIDLMGTATAKLGVVFDRWLVYGKGGFAWARESHLVQLSSLVDPTVGGTATGKELRSGLVIGAGVAYAWKPNWSLKLDYDYIDLGTTQVTFFGIISGVPAFLPFEIKQNVQTIKLGLNYRFNAPIVTRY